MGFVAIFMSDPTRARIVSVDVNEMALKIQDKSANITVEDLADRLIQKKADFVLIDLRDEAKYNEYNIPSSINSKAININSLGLSKTQKVILYSDDNLQAAQAWFLLKSKNYKGVYMLSGGMAEWKSKILFPEISENATAEEKATFAKIAEISKFFGGTPRIKGAEAEVLTQQTVTPKMVAPTAPTQAKGGKPKREGC
jgi:3-mercaptopyruvate sulfurtransferase SseA